MGANLPPNFLLKSYTKKRTYFAHILQQTTLQKMKLFNSKKAAFGRHETFSLRYSWLTKGFQAFTKNPAIFTSDDATVELGVGKNMVNAIKYWLLAGNFIEQTPTAMQPTLLGEKIFAAENGFDPYLEDEATLWLVHWQFATNAELATAWYWFFNKFHQHEFSSEEAKSALTDFVKTKLNGSYSERSVEHDVMMILKMYSPVTLRANMALDEQLDAPLTTLHLMSCCPFTHRYQTLLDDKPRLPFEIVAFAVNEIFEQRADVSQLPIEELMYEHNQSIAVGAVFRLTEAGLLAKLELLSKHYPNHYQIRESAGINQLYRGEKIDSQQFLTDYYQNRDANRD